MIFKLTNAHNKLKFEVDEGLCCHSLWQHLEKLIQVDLNKKLRSC